MKVELKNIHKSFGDVHANAGISLEVPAGSIQGILGENGAGKSTLMKILSGYIHADRGEIILDERPISIQSPADAIQQGIGMLHQDPLDFPPMQIIDNFLVGRDGGLLPNKRNVFNEFVRLQNEFGFSIDPEAYIDSLTVGERQQVEIMRLLWLGAGVLILDEPTTGISTQQKEKLFATLKRLAGQGKTILFVSHKLEEVEELCDQVAVLRQGKLMGEVNPPYDTDQLVEMMFGKVIPSGDMRSPSAGEITLQLKNVSVEVGRLRIDDVNLEVRGGEVIGLAGMEGSGQNLFLRACAGLIRPVGGHVFVRDQDMTRSHYREFQRKGVAFLPASRLEEGLIPGLSLTEHFILSEGGNGFFINWESSRELARQRIIEFNIRGTAASKVESLSGGNQQRTLLALLKTPLSLILLEHPTRGLDIESTIYIWAKLKERCQEGTAILFISSDLDEILQYSDHVLVFFSGRISPFLDPSTTDVEQLGQLIGGKGWSRVFEGQGNGNDGVT
jgi:general nucleoside transport system ATP-binding protein